MYEAEIGDLSNKAIWDAFSADQDGWVPPAMLSAARDIQIIKNVFGNSLATGTRKRRGRSRRGRDRRGLLADGIVTVSTFKKIRLT